MALCLLQACGPQSSSEEEDEAFAEGNHALSVNGLNASYFDNIDFTGTRVSRIDRQVHFTWGTGAPAAGLGAERFSARWNGFVRAPVTGVYTFFARADDGVRLQVNGQRLVDAWIDQSPTERSGTVSLTAGSYSPIALDYFENTGGAVISLSWTPPGGTKQVIPAAQLFTEVPTAVTCPSGQYEAQYFNNPSLSGTPALTRCEATVTHDWASASPAPGVNADGFSVRWTQVSHFAAGSYAFTTTADDGIRLTVDPGTSTALQVINNWVDQGATTRTATAQLTAGVHKVVIEYYENTGSATAKVSYAAASSPACDAQTCPSAPPVADLNFDWDTGNYSQWLSSPYGRFEVGDPLTSHQTQLTRTRTRNGTGYANRFEMHNAGEDVASGTFRSMWSRYDTNDGLPQHPEVYWGFSMMLPREGGQTQVPSYLHVFELHQRANIYSRPGSAAIAPHAVMVRNNRLEYRMMTGAFSWSGSQWTGPSAYYDQVPLLPSISLDVWYDVIVHLRFSEGSDGLLEVWARPAGTDWSVAPQLTLRAPTLPYLPAGLDPGAPRGAHTYEASGGLTGLYAMVGLYNGSSSWSGANSQNIYLSDNVRRYNSLANARAGFPVR